MLKFMALVGWSKCSFLILIWFFVVHCIFMKWVKKYFIKKYEPAYIDEVDGEFFKKWPTEKDRFAQYMRAMVFPDFMNLSLFRRKSIKAMASLNDRTLAYIYVVSVLAFIFQLISALTTYAAERLEIVDLGLGFWGREGGGHMGGLNGIVIDSILDYIFWLMHSREAAIVNFVCFGVLILIFWIRKKK